MASAMTQVTGTFFLFEMDVLRAVVVDGTKQPYDKQVSVIKPRDIRDRSERDQGCWTTLHGKSSQRFMWLYIGRKSGVTMPRNLDIYVREQANSDPTLASGKRIKGDRRRSNPAAVCKPNLGKSSPCPVQHRLDVDEARRGRAWRGETTYHGHKETSRVELLGHSAHLYECVTRSTFPKMPFVLLALRGGAIVVW